MKYTVEFDVSYHPIDNTHPEVDKFTEEIEEVMKSKCTDLEIDYREVRFSVAFNIEADHKEDVHEKCRSLTKDLQEETAWYFYTDIIDIRLSDENEEEE